MRQRCLNPRAFKFPSYGGAGITLCERWNSFDNFLEDMGERPEGCTLDRIDGTKGYSPDNCRWATSREQMDNIRTVTRVSFRGEEMTLSQLSMMLGIGKFTLKYRIDQGWTDDEIASKPEHGNRSRGLSAV